LTERTVDDHRQLPARYGAMGSALRGRLAAVLLHHVGGHDLSNPVYDNYDAIIEAISEAWNNLIEIPETIKSIGMREWAHLGRSE